MTKENCEHCYCLEGDTGLNGPKCQEPFEQCCRCEDKRAVPVTTPFDWNEFFLPRERTPSPRDRWPYDPPQFFLELTGGGFDV